MDYQELPAAERRAQWWSWERRKFDLPGFLYHPLLFAVILVAVLGAGSGFIGLLPGVDTHRATLSGVGAPWLGLVTLVGIAALWYWQALHNGYPLPWMAAIVVAAAAVLLLITDLALKELAVTQTDTFIGGLGTGLLMGGLGLLMGLALDGLLLGILLGLLMGVVIGVLLGLPLDFEAILIMALINSTIMALTAGIGGMLHPFIKKLLRKQTSRRA